jgi:predicted small lipoprotein YifL
MSRRVLFLLLSFTLVVFSGCGKKGPIEPPLARVPQTVQQLTVLQRGEKVFLSWINPEAYIDGNPIAEVAVVEVWLIEEDRSTGSTGKKWTKADFENKAELLSRLPADQFSALRSGEPAKNELTYVYTPKTEDFNRKVLTFALRVKDKKNRSSDFSEPVPLGLVSPPVPPQKVRAEIFEDHIQVRWEDAAGPNEEISKPGGYNLYRSGEKGQAQRLNSALIKKQEFRDKDFSFGQTYRYFVRAVRESAPQVESDDSEPVDITPQDTFPPGPPSGLTAIGGSGVIALSWEAGRESDLEGYRIWRRVNGEADFVIIATLTASESSFQDAKVEKNTRYEYAITALDTAGNESRKSEPARGIMRDNPPA